MKWMTWSLALLVGCASSPSYMTRAEEPGPDRPPPGKAMVVFLRFMTHRVRNDVIVDAKGRFIAQVPARAHVKHVTDPGFHRYMILGKHPEIIEADMAAGRTYFVSVWTGPTYEGSFTDSTSLKAVRRDGLQWADIERALRETEEWTVDLVLLEEWRRRGPTGPPRQLQRADRYRAEFIESYGEERWQKQAVLRPEDGQ